MRNEIFTVTLTNKDDWDKRHQGWRCSALNIPGAEILEIRDSRGNKRDKSDYEQEMKDLPYVTWKSVDNICDITVVITLTKKLTTQKVLILWQFLTGIATIISLVLAVSHLMTTNDILEHDIQKKSTNLSQLSFDILREISKNTNIIKYNKLKIIINSKDFDKAVSDLLESKCIKFISTEKPDDSIILTNEGKKLIQGGEK